MGFTSFGLLVNTTLLKEIFVPVITLASPVLTFIIVSSSPVGDVGCDLTEAERLAFQHTAGLINATCVWNLTVGAAVGVTVH